MKNRKRFRNTVLSSLLLIFCVSIFVVYYSVSANDISGKITLEKTATVEDVNDARTADVSLEIHTSDLDQVTTDIILIMDRSGSMAKTICVEYSQNGRTCIKNDYRLTVAKEQAIGLIKSLLPENNSGNIKIGVVTFGTDYEKRYSTQTYNDMTSNQDSAVNMINNIQLNNNNGTNVQAGLKAAQLLLDDSTADNKIIILISDGEPTYFTLDNGTLCGDGNSDSLSSSDPRSCKELVKPSYAAELEATELKNPNGKYNAEIYAIGYGDQNGKLADFLTNQIASKSDEITYEYNATDTDELKTAMEAIAKNIKHILATDARVEDYIPEGFDLTEESITELKVTYGDNITISNENGQTKILIKYDTISSNDGTYKINYKVKAKDDYNGAMYTNSKATFYAKPTSDNKYYTSDIELVFDKPVVPIAPVTKDDDLTSNVILEGQKTILDKDTIIANDIINQEISKIVIQDKPGLQIPDSTVNNKIIIDSVSCGTAIVNTDGNIEYTASKNCEGNPTIEYHIESDITIYQYNNGTLEKEDYTVISVGSKNINNETTYTKSSTILLAVDRVPVTYQVKYLEKDTNQVLVPTKTVNAKDRDVITETALTGYESSLAGVEILRQYELVNEKTQTITLSEDENLIVFYYTKKTIKTEEPELIKESTTTEITSLKDSINYTISYSTEIDDFKGELIVTLIDSLPHKIIESESNYKCTNTSEYSCTSVYNEEKETITYTLKYNIDTFATGRKYIIDFNINISLKYDENDFDGSEESIVNRVSAHLTADETKIDSFDDKEIPADIEGKVNARYVYLDDNNTEISIAQGKYDVTIQNKVGTDYETKKKSILGYTYKETRGTEKGKIKEGTIEVIYVYTKDPAEVTEEPTVIKKVNEGTIIESTNQKITYSVDYKTTVKNYDGDVTLKVVDTLEYPVEEVIVNSTGWTVNYDGNRTIVFTKNEHVHTSITSNNEVEIEALLNYTIKLKKFSAENDQDSKFINKAKGSITLLTKTTEGNETEEEVPINVLGNVLLHFKEVNTNRTLQTSQYIFPNDVVVGTDYETPSVKINGYEFVSSTNNTTGIVKEDLTEVTYYYKRLSATPEQEILTKDGTTSITSVNEVVEYNIYYDAIIKNYEGNVKITMVDKLPYKIDLTKSTIGGNYIYDDANQTITWVIFEEENIKATDEIPVSYETELALSYIGIDPSIKNFTNKVEIHIVDGTDDDTVTTEEHVTNVDVKGTVIVKHIDDNTGKEIDEVSPVILNGKVGISYTTSPVNISGYELVQEKYPTNASGTYIDGQIEVIYRYKKIKVELTDESIDKISSTTHIVSKNQNVDYEINYNALIKYRGDIIVTIIDKLEYPIDITKSELSGGIYNENDLTITWEESIDNLNTYLIGNSYHINIQKIVSLRYKNIPSNGIVKNIATAHIKTEEGKTNEPTPAEVDIETEIKGNLIVEYIYVADNGEIKELHSYTSTDYVGNTYETEAKKFNSYTLSQIPSNKNGNIVEGTTRVTYFYSKTPAQVIENKVEKESTNKVVTNVDEAFNYNIDYNTELDEYIGKATVTIVDKLSNKIDTERSNIQGGIYNENDLTITWIKEYDVNTYENINKVININIELSLYYKDLNPEERVVKNTVSTKFTVDTLKEPVETEDETETRLEVQGKVIAKYVDIYGKELSSKVETIGLVGEIYQTSLKTIEGYNYKETKGNPNGKYIDGEIEVIYVYEKDLTSEVLPPNTNAKSYLSELFTISLIGLFIGIKKFIK